MRQSLIWVFTLLLLLIPNFAKAVDYVTTTDGIINGATACGTTDLVRTFNVTDNFTIADVDLGFQADYTWRGDINLRLQSPAGTMVQLIATNVTATGNLDNYNVLLDDAAATPVNVAPHNTPDGTIAPPYENLVQPSNPLSAFNGQNSAGTWSLLMCDSFPGADNGTFDISTLTLIEDVTPPTGPALSCPIAEQIAFNRGTANGVNGWPAATLNNNYTIGASIPMDITVGGDTGFLIPRNGVDTPVTSTEMTGRRSAAKHATNQC